VRAAGELSVDDSTALNEGLIGLAAYVAGPPSDESEDELRRSMSTLVVSVKRVAPSYSGLAITVVIDDQPVTLTSLEPFCDVSAIVTSMRLSLGWLTSLSSASQITFYAATPGTFVDLAADLSFVVGAVCLRLDQDLPARFGPDLNGVNELSAINRAIGILVGHGHTLDSAQRELQRMADTAAISLSQAAGRVRTYPTDPRLDRVRA
jgi:hypothetical protein